MLDTEPSDALSPLDQIRQAEAEVAGRLASAREAVAHQIAQVQEENRRLLAEAREAGHREGEIAYRDAVAAAEEEAGLIRAAGQEQAVTLRRRGHERLAAAALLAVRLVLGDEDGHER